MLEKFFKEERSLCNEELRKYFENHNKDEKEVLFSDFMGQLEEFIINDKAKRIHPILLVTAYSGIVNPVYLEDQIDEIRKVSIAVELLHSAHLIQDDFIDDDSERRGKPTFHIQLENEINKVYKSINIEKKNELAKLYGRDLSILGGAMGYFLGLDVIRTSRFPNHVKLLAINKYTEAISSLMKGQVIEEYMNYHNITMTLEQYLNIAEMQRAVLFEKSTEIGAILARGNIHYQIKPLGEAMLRIGQAYAIRDDILDMRDDIKNKKRKFIYILAIQNTDEDQSKRLNDLFKKEKLTKNDVQEVEVIFAETHALIIAEQFSKNLVKQSKNYLNNIYPDLNKEQKVFFDEFSDFIYMREF
ncbi:MAG: polyprenyl synthetase family protein [Promethearchaeota archaeon]